MRETIAGLAAAMLLAGCASMGGGGLSATAKLAPTKGNTTSGSVSFRQSGARVMVSAAVSGLKPGGEHGFHVHEKGDCSSGDGMSTGGHFNPQGKRHGGYPSAERHGGDMPNLRADQYGNASFSVELDNVTVADGPTSVVGKGVIVHAMADDYKTQPTGNAGARLACGVVQRS